MAPAVLWKGWLLNIATVVVTLTALAVGAIRIEEHIAARNAEPLRPTHIDTWHNYAMVGQRMGPINARVTIVEFADFQCPFCRAAAKDLVELRHRYPALAVIYRHYPLPAHQNAMTAAIAAVCAGRSGQFASFHELLFRQQDSIGIKPWSQFAREAGVRDVRVFESCLDDSLSVRAVEVDRSDGDRLGMEGTPTLLINDLKIDGYPGRAKLDSFVRSALRDQ